MGNRELLSPMGCLCTNGYPLAASAVTHRLLLVTHGLLQLQKQPMGVISLSVDKPDSDDIQIQIGRLSEQFWRIQLCITTVLVIQWIEGDWVSHGNTQHQSETAL